MIPKIFLQDMINTKTLEVSKRFPIDFRSLANRSFLFGLLLCLFLIACTPPAPTDAPEGISGNEASETESEYTVYLPLSESNASNTGLPSDAPLAEWTAAGGVIPIMPGAIAGKSQKGWYAFTTSAAVADIENYYLQELANRGWKSLSIGESEGVKDLLFEIGETRLTIHVEFLAAQNITYVVIEG